MKKSSLAKRLTILSLAAATAVAGGPTLVPKSVDAHSDQQLADWDMGHGNDGSKGAWLQSLSSKKAGSCCNGFDGRPPQAVVQTKENHYQVLLENQWVDVPDDAVITEPNKYGAAVVWYSPTRRIQGSGKVETEFNIRCFLPGELY